MDRAQKAAFVERLSGELAEASLVLLTDYRGTTVEQASTVRRGLKARGVRMMVVKNTLARLAIAGSEAEGLAEYFTGMTGLLLGSGDGIATARAVREVLDPKGPIRVKAGLFEKQVLDAAQAARLADMPNREELLASLLRTIQEGPRLVMSAIRAPARDLLYLLKNYERKLASAEGGE